MDPSKISGWILPDGTYKEVEEWWHVSYIYECRDGGDALFQDDESRLVLDGGEEAAIRDLAAKKGFIKISRGEIDGYSMTPQQLRQLQGLLDLCDPDFEFRLLVEGGKVLKSISVARLMKIRNPQLLFDT